MGLRGLPPPTRADEAPSFASRQLPRGGADAAGRYFIVGMTKALSSTAPSGQRAVMVFTLV